MAVQSRKKIAILTRGKRLHSIRRIQEEAKKLKITCELINPLECQMVIDEGKSRIMTRNLPLPRFDAVLPRIGASMTDYGISIVRHFEMLGIYTVNSSQAIADSRNKMRSLQVMNQAGLLVPSTVLTRTTQGLHSAVDAVKGLPVVLKVLRGTQGMGVMLVNTPISLESVLDTLRTLDQDVIIQQFIVEGAGSDYRVFVIGNEVIATMMRTAPRGEFRSNIHRGGSGNSIQLPSTYEQTAIRAAKILGLEIAGVDLMESHSGPMVIEVNSSPGFEGIEKATRINVAKKIVEHMIRRRRKKTA